PGLAQQITENLQGALGNREFEVLSIDAVGPKVGSELKRQGVTSVAATLGLVLLYVAFRFDVAFAPGAIIALFHDVSVTIGIFTLLQLEFNLPMIGALLTIVGYSLNDTIVIYDRIRENQDRYRREETIKLINVSINETLSRTLATSGTTLMAIVAFLVLGGPIIQNFAFAMFLGIIFGTYSTIYVASPMILVMEDMKPY
ncbi:MAG: protein translocase subunit SecF, partial [Phycisphaerales bacterium]|nr:protein translocase subunit SecF [Phycisphaerales bacterium]